MDASGVRRSWVTDEKRAARSAFASTWSLRLPDLAVQGRPLDRERRLRGERLHQAELGWGERLLARSPSRRQSPVGARPGLQGNRDRMSGSRSLVTCGRTPDTVRCGDLGAGEPEEVEERLRQTIEDATEGLAGDEALGGALEELCFGGPLLGSRALLADPADQGSHDQRGQEERDQRDDVGCVPHGEGVMRLREEEVEAEEREEGGEDPAAAARDRAGDDDGEQGERASRRPGSSNR